MDLAPMRTDARVIVRGDLTRFWVAEHRGAAAEGGAAAIVTDAATAAAQAATPHCSHQLDLFGGAHWRNRAKNREVRKSFSSENNIHIR